jgi:hypothetical protein
LEPCDEYGNLINPNQNKPLIYAYDIEKEDGWLYTRASLKYAFTIIYSFRSDSKHIFRKLNLSNGDWVTGFDLRFLFHKWNFIEKPIVQKNRKSWLS